MNDVQDKIAQLESRRWTLAAVADELGVTVNAIEKWKAGDRYPANGKAILRLMDTLTQRRRVPKQRRYLPGMRTKAIVGGTQQMVKPGDGAMMPIYPKSDIPSSKSLPIFVAEKWGFPLQHHDDSGTDFYSIKDWIAGLTSSPGAKATEMWRDFKRRSGDKGGVVSNPLPYIDSTNGQTYRLEFTNDEGLYKLAMVLRVTKGRTALKAIKDFLAKAGVFADEARRDPEGAAEKLAVERRAKALRDGKPEDWIATRELGVITRKQFVSRIYQLVKDKPAFGMIIGAITNDVYRGVFESDVSGLRARLGITTKENPRDHFSRIALAYTTVAEESVKIFLGNYSDHDFVPVQTIHDVVTAISGAVGVQAKVIAEALQIDIVSGRKLSDAPLGQGKFESLLKDARKRLPPGGKAQ